MKYNNLVECIRKSIADAILVDSGRVVEDVVYLNHYTVPVEWQRHGFLGCTELGQYVNDLRGRMEYLQLIYS